MTPIVSNPKNALPATTVKNDAKPVAWFAWATLGYNVAVILWGAYVRATGSGAGCGNHWPLCNGDVIPTTPQAQTIIEFTHRVTSGLAFITVVTLFVWCWRRTSKSARLVRSAATLSLLFMINEALLGALLVKLNHVAQDTSVARAAFLSMHFANTLLLLASIGVTAYLLSREPRHPRVVASRSETIMIGLGLLAAMTMGITGSLAALGDTLFPATSLRSSLAQDFSSSSYYLIRLRFVHPLAAVVGAIYVSWLIRKNLSQRTASHALSILVMTLLVLQLGLGVVNVLLLAPVWLQLVHLLVADLLWISLVLASADLLFDRAPVQVSTLELKTNPRRA